MAKRLAKIMTWRYSRTLRLGCHKLLLAIYRRKWKINCYQTSTVYITRGKPESEIRLQNHNLEKPLRVKIVCANEHYLVDKSLVVSPCSLQLKFNVFQTMNMEQSSLEFLYQAMLMSIKIVTLHVAKPRSNARNVTRGKENLSRDSIWTWRGWRDQICSHG